MADGTWMDRNGRWRDDKGAFADEPMHPPDPIPRANPTKGKRRKKRRAQATPPPRPTADPSSSRSTGPSWVEAPPPRATGEGWGEVPPPPPNDDEHDPEVIDPEPEPQTAPEQEPEPEADSRPPGMSTADALRMLGIGNVWAGVVRAAGTPRGWKPAPVMPQEIEMYTEAWAQLADRYFPELVAPELVLFVSVTAVGVLAARKGATPPPKPKPSPESQDPEAEVVDLEAEREQRA